MPAGTFVLDFNKIETDRNIQCTGRCATYDKFTGILTRTHRLQKRAIRIMVGAGFRDSCRKTFSSLKILPLPSLYIFSVLMFVVNNWEMFILIIRTHIRLRQETVLIFIFPLLIYRFIRKVLNLSELSYSTIFLIT
jgi:hypothetical protein